MPSDRWYSLRHPDGFNDELFGRFCAAARVWVTWMNAVVRDAEFLHPLMEVPDDSVEYRVEQSKVSEDRNIVTVGISGGPSTYGWLKTFEDEYPEQLYRWLPLWLRPELEVGRRDSRGFSPETLWNRLHSPDEAEELRKHPMFQRP